ncbi:MAG: hypothetical protein IE933_03370 [Sphingomonadales bacterium]|nr:hypothetical protein [Sphingomonadales bacterium]MBD3772080.1 hypothetical protein [Paracoccaceae bacterium]
MKTGWLILLLALASCGPQSSDEASADLNYDIADDDGAGALPPVSDGDIARASLVDVAEIVAAYEANELTAQRDYEGRWLAVEGTIDSVSSDFGDEPVIHLSADVLPTPSIRLAAGFEQQALDVKKGDRVTFLCGRIKSFMGSPRLSECQLVLENMVAGIREN